MDINETAPCQADFVCCLSVLEHMDPPRQACALRSLCDAVEPGGLLLLTFDIPGFEWDTDLDMYRHILRQREFDFIEVEVAEEQRVTSRNGPVAYAGWESLGRLELECYRLLAWHIGVSENRFSNEGNSSLQNPGESTVEVFPYTLAADGLCGEGSV